MNDEKSRIRLLMGTTGSGKTTKMHKLLLKERRAFLFDLMGAEQFENWGVVCDSLADGLRLAERCIASDLPYRIRFQFSDVDRFNFLCSLGVKKPHGKGALRDFCIAVDELAMFCSSQWLPSSLENIVRLGRHTGCRFMATTQRAPDIHPFIRSQAKEQYLFQTHEPADLDYYRKRLQEPERLITLKVGECLLWTPGQTEKFLSARHED